MGKGVEIALRRQAEAVGGDEHRAGGAQGDVAAALSHGARAHGSGGIVSGAGGHHHALRQSQIHCDLRQHRAHGLVALQEPGHLSLGDAAVGKELSTPAAVGHVQEEHARGVGIVAAVDAGKAVDQIVLGQHDFLDFCKVFRLVAAHPQKLWRREPGEGEISHQGEELFAAEVLVELPGLLAGAAVVPENGRANHPILPVQRHQAVHLPAYGQAGYLVLVHLRKKLPEAGSSCLPPVRGILLRPAGTGEGQRIRARGRLDHGAALVHRQHLHRRSPEIHTQIEHVLHLSFHVRSHCSTGHRLWLYGF